MLAVKTILNTTIANKWLLFLFILLHIIITVSFIRKQNITYDEPGYIEYSKRWLHGHSERATPLDDSKTPVISIVWLPRIVKQLINPNYKLNDYGRQDQKEGRYMMLVFSILTCIYLYYFCVLLQLKKWWIVFLFFIIDPLITAYAILINSDLLSGLLLLAIVYHLYLHLKNKRDNQLYIASILFGIALVTKHTFLFAIPLVVIFLFITNQKRFFKRLIITSFIALLVINVAFYFQGTGKSLGSYQFQSSSFIALQEALHFFKWVPVPLPVSYLQSMDLLQYHAQLGGSSSNTYTGVYLLGKTNLQSGFWYYYLVTALYKIPLSILLLLVTGIILFVIRIKKVNMYWYVLIIPVVYFFLVLSFFNKFQIGIRHLIIILPLLYVLIAVVINELFLLQKRWLVMTLWLWMFCSVLYYYPHLIPYTNELITNKSTVYKKIMDSSIDYGQSDSAAVQFLKNHPDYTNPTNKPSSGRYLVSMRYYIEKQKFGDTSLNWLINNHEPSGLIYFTHLQYDIK